MGLRNIIQQYDLYVAKIEEIEQQRKNNIENATRLLEGTILAESTRMTVREIVDILPTHGKFLIPESSELFKKGDDITILLKEMEGYKIIINGKELYLQTPLTGSKRIFCENVKDVYITLYTMRTIAENDLRIAMQQQTLIPSEKDDLPS